jgi:hypothetical protein
MKRVLLASKTYVLRSVSGDICGSAVKQTVRNRLFARIYREIGLVRARSRIKCGVRRCMGDVGSAY